MTAMDEMGLKLCKVQARIFSQSTASAQCSSPVFIRRFMNSDIAARMDRGSFLFEAVDEKGVFSEIEEEYGACSYGKVKFSENELYWLGYIYRYWCYTHQKTSKQVYKLIKPSELKALYFPYHSLDPAMAIERILEAKGLSEADMTKRGVQLLRMKLQQEKRNGGMEK